jgi:hypothetical protein
MKAGRRDKNHKEIRDALRAAGYFVVDTASVGGGVPDLCVFTNSNSPIWVEIKSAKGKPNAAQLEWKERAESYGCKVVIVYTAEQALQCVNSLT